MISEKYSNEGNSTFSIDGGTATTVSMASSTRQVQQTVFTASGLTNGTHTLKITKTSGTYLVIDAYIVNTLAPVVPASSTYGQSVLAAGPTDYWRLDEASGTTASDYAGSSNLTEGAGVTHSTAGAITGDPDTADTFSGTSTGWAQTTTAVTGPQTFTEQAWIKTSSKTGGKIIGFGSGVNGALSSSNDRNVYMDNAGHLIFGVYPGSVVTIASPSTYNDGKWHQVNATLSSAGMMLYVDGKLVASNATTTTAQQFSGYWRVGGDTLSGWTSAPTSNFFNGSIDEVAIYPTALTAAQITPHVHRQPPAGRLVHLDFEPRRSSQLRRARPTRTARSPPTPGRSATARPRPERRRRTPTRAAARTR